MAEPKKKTSDLPNSIVESIKEMWDRGVPVKDIAAAHELHHMAVVGLARGRRWPNPRKKEVDEEALGRDWRAGILTLGQIAEKYGLEAYQVQNLVKKRKWGRDLAQRIQQETTSRLQEEVAKSLAAAQEGMTEAAIVEANVALQATITRHHRTGATSTRESILKLVGELGAFAVPQDELDRFAEIAALQRSQQVEDFDAQNQEYAKALATFQRLVELPSRARTAKDLVAALASVVELERKVYGIKEEVQENDLVAALRELAGPEGEA